MIIQIALSGAKIQGLGAGKAPFGAFEGKVAKYQVKPIESGENEGLMGLNVWVDVTGGTNEDAIGRQIVVYDVIARPEDLEGDSPRIDVNDDKGKRKLDVITAKLRRLMIATADSEESAKKRMAAKGSGLSLDLDKELATGKPIRIHYDPADEQAAVKQYDEHRWLTATEYAKVREGKIRIPRANTYGLTAEEAALMGVKRGPKDDGSDQGTAEAKARREARVKEAGAAGATKGTSAVAPAGATGFEARKAGKGSKVTKKPEPEPEPEPADGDGDGDADGDDDAVENVL